MKKLLWVLGIVLFIGMAVTIIYGTTTTIKEHRRAILRHLPVSEP